MVDGKLGRFWLTNICNSGTIKGKNNLTRRLFCMIKQNITLFLLGKVVHLAVITTNTI